MPPQGSTAPKSTFNAKMLSSNQKRQLQRNGSFRTSTGSFRDAQGNTVTPPSNTTTTPNQSTAPVAPAMVSTPLQSPVPATDVTPTPSLGLPEPVATQTQAATQNSIQGSVDQARSRLDTMLTTDKARVDTEIAALEKDQEMILAQGKELTQPFREKLEKKERERLKVNENFEANQKLVDELDTLLTQGNELINIAMGRQVANKVLDKSLSKTIADVQARAGVIEAVMSARNGQISQAYTMIDRTVDSIVADRNDELSYLNTVLSLNENKIIRLDEESKKIAETQRSEAIKDLDEAKATAKYIKDLMINPETAQFMADAGVSLNDGIDGVKKKMSEQAKRQEIIDTRNQLVDAGYELTPTMVPGGIEIEAGGQKLYARVRPGSPLDLQLKAQEANIAQSYAAAAASRASAAATNAKMLLERALTGDPKAIEQLGYDPNSVNGGLAGAQNYEAQKADLQMGVDAAKQVLGNKSGIKLLTGAVQSPFLAGIGQSVGAGAAGGAAVGTVVPGAGTLAGAGFGTVAGLIASPFNVSRMKQNKDSAVGALNFLVNDATFNEVIDLKAQGVTFGSMTEGERIAAGRAAERLSAAVAVNESGQVTSISATPEEVETYVRDLMRAYEGRQEYLDASYSISRDENDEAKAVWNE